MSEQLLESIYTISLAGTGVVITFLLYLFAFFGSCFIKDEADRLSMRFGSTIIVAIISLFLACLIGANGYPAFRAVVTGDMEHMPEREEILETQKEEDCGKDS